MKASTWFYSSINLMLAMTTVTALVLGLPTRPPVAPPTVPNGPSAPAGVGVVVPSTLPPDPEWGPPPAETVYANGVTVKSDWHHDLSEPLSELVKQELPPEPGPVQYKTMPEPRSYQVLPTTLLNDPVIQSSASPNAMPALLTNFAGIGNSNNNTLYSTIFQPPDTDGDVGPNHYFEWDNNAFSVYNKAGTRVLGPSKGSTIWAGFGGACASNDDGDPIVLYDWIADRWHISQFTASAPFTECIAISQTPDPTGAWYRYGFLLSASGLFYDYPHAGVWPDGYYYNFNVFNDPAGTFNKDSAIVFERSKMLLGVAATMQELSNTTNNSLMPSDLEGEHLPPLGRANYYMRALAGNSNTTIRLWKFHVDWVTPANSTFGLTASHTPDFTVTTAAYNRICPGTTRQQCITFPGGTLEALGDRVMWRMSYRNFLSYESLVTDYVVDPGTGFAGMRFIELRNLATTPTVFQEGTYAPADSMHRFGGTIAQDRMGNMGMVFSKSSAAAGNPQLMYAGRLVGDTAGQLAQGESLVIASNGQQTGGGRWGDYANISLDPTDDCTMWFIGEYLLNTGVAFLDWSEWSARIGSFKFATCVPPPTCFSDAADTWTNFNHTSATSAATDDWAVLAVGGAQGNVFRAANPATSVDKSVFLGQAIPVGPTSVGTILAFQHKYTLGTGDGAVIEGSTDGGLTWVAINTGVTNNVFSQGGPVGTIASAGNPLNGRTAWQGSNGYFALVKVNLSLQFPDQNVLIRWRLGTDAANAGTDWQIDNVKVENCATDRDLLSGFLYADCNNDGARATAFNESGISGVTMQMVGDASGSTVTNAQGYWQFSTAPAGANYTVAAVRTSVPNGPTTPDAPAIWNVANNGNRCAGTGWPAGSNRYWNWGENGGSITFSGMGPGAPDSMPTNSRNGLKADGLAPTAVIGGASEINSVPPPDVRWLIPLIGLVAVALALAFRKR